MNVIWFKIVLYGFVVCYFGYCFNDSIVCFCVNVVWEGVVDGWNGIGFEL